MLKHLCILFPLTLPLQVFAETAQKNPLSTPGSVIAAESMTQMIAALMLVLLIIIAIAWLLKRFAIIPSTSTGLIKIVSAASVGQRERIVIVDIGETRLVLGVAPGQVNKLHSMKNSSLEAVEKTPKKAVSPFSEKLDNSIHKGN
ncbi:MAG: flagellar biosynthetic protein FliO [Nitrosomonas sp.]|nr:flagellar biosynthetic protein FliO [Nitrosomonas sp.]